MQMRKVIIFFGIVIVTIISVVVGSIYVHFFPGSLSDFSLIQALTVQETVSFSVTIVNNSEHNLTVPAAGNVRPTNSFISRKITNITQLPANSTVNITLLGVNHPSSWTEPEANSTEVGHIIEHIDIAV